ncbi:unnamed protein product, partial [Cuscuta europaea]
MGSTNKEARSGHSDTVSHAAENQSSTPTHDIPTFTHQADISASTSGIQHKRLRKPPVWHCDYDVRLNTVKINSPPHVCVAPNADSALSAHKEPTSYHEVVRDP